MLKTFQIFKNKYFSVLFLASVTSQLGSLIGMTALVFYFLDRFSSQPYLATINELMFTLPSLVVFWLVGVAADRLDRQKIAASCDLISAVLSLVLLLTLMTDLLWLTFLVIFLRAGVSKFFAPAEQAILQGILQKSDYPVAAGLNQMISSLFMIFGNGIGVAVYWFLGTQGAIFIDLCSFLISALLIRSLKIDRHVRLPNGPHRFSEIKLQMIYSDFKTGLAYIIKNKVLSSLVASFGIFGIINGGGSVMFIFMLKYQLAPVAYEQLSVWVGMVAGVGILIGSVMASVVAGRWSFIQMIVMGLSASGLFMIGAGYSPNVPVFFFMIFFTTLFIPLVNVAIGGWLPAIVDPKMMGRVESWSTPIMMLSQSVTLGLISISFPQWVSIGIIFLIVGLAMVLAAIYYALVIPRQLKRAQTIQEGIRSPH